jgi:hypothetical protein
MLQRSLLAAPLVKHAAAAVQVQQFCEAGRRCDQLGIEDTTPDYVKFAFSLRRLSGENPNLLPSVLSSGLASAGTVEEKHIHFNEQVKQFISLEMNGDEKDESSSYTIHDYVGSDSGGGASIIKGTNSKRGIQLISNGEATTQARFSVNSKTIAVLPSTTLTCGENAPSLLETTMKHNNGQPLSAKKKKTTWPRRAYLLNKELAAANIKADVWNTHSQQLYAISKKPYPI